MQKKSVIFIIVADFQKKSIRFSQFLPNKLAVENNHSEVQQLFFQHIKNNLAPHLSFVDEIAELLNISNDSAYRRIRGEKTIDLEEIQKLSDHFKISLDQFLHLQSDSFIFTGMLHENTSEFFGRWMKDVLEKASYINSFEKKHLYFIGKDLPFMSFFHVPELVTFKSFMWMRTFLHVDDMKEKKFSLKNRYPEYEKLGSQINRVLNEIPTTELWNLECVNATLQQIRFYREANVFESKEDVLVIYDKLEELVTHYEKMAEAGKRFAVGETPGPKSPAYNLFINELFLGNNTWIAELNNIKMTVLNHSVLHIIVTRDERFSNYVYAEMENMIRKSSQISTVGEKTRSRFFNRLREKIQRSKSTVS